VVLEDALAVAQPAEEGVSLDLVGDLEFPPAELVRVCL
jgi:hypothetical protein